MKKALVTAFFILIALYTAFQARYLILGPRISIDSPANDSAVDVGILPVRGLAESVSFLMLDDRTIYTDKDGRWQEKLIAEPGINIIKLAGKDRFGREKIVLVRIFAK